jgi:hypothetical protein
MGSDSASFWHAKSSMADSIVRLRTKEHAALRAPVLPFLNMSRSDWRSTVSPNRSVGVFSGACIPTMTTGSTSGSPERGQARCGGMR